MLASSSPLDFLLPLVPEGAFGDKWKEQVYFRPDALPVPQLCQNTEGNISLNYWHVFSSLLLESWWKEYCCLYASSVMSVPQNCMTF